MFVIVRRNLFSVVVLVCGVGKVFDRIGFFLEIIIDDLFFGRSEVFTGRYCVDTFVFIFSWNELR